MSDGPFDLEWTPELVARYWEEEVQQTRHSFAGKHSRPIVSLIRRFMPPPRRIVDVGGGPGLLTSALLDAGYAVATIEDAANGRRLTEQLNAGHPGFLGIASVDGLAGMNPFDGAVAVELLEHIPDDDVDQLMATLRRSITGSGSCFFTTPNQEDLGGKQVCCPNCGARFHRWQHVRSVNEQWLRRTLESSGFSVTSVLTTDFDRAMPARLRGRGPRLLKSHPPHLVAVARPR